MTQDARSRNATNRPRRLTAAAVLGLGLVWLAAAGAMQAQAPVARPVPPPSPVAAPAPAATPAPAQASDPQADADYIIGPTDVLSIVIHDDKEITSELTVRPDGKITLPLINDVVAAGLTPAQLRVRITELEKRFIKVPVVTVIVKQVNNNRAFITGQVRTPGSYVLPGPTTVLQLLAMAGGFAEFADREHILIARVEQGVQASFTFNYDRALKKQDLSQNILLKPGDTVVVPDDMMRRTRPCSLGARRIAIALTVVAVTAVGSPARAQQAGQGGLTPVTQAARPYRGLFGAGTGAAPGRHLFALTASIYQEYGSNLDSGIPSSDLVLREGWFLGVGGQLSFEKAGQYSRIGLRGAGSFRYVRELEQTTSPRFRAELTVDSRTGARKQNPLRLTGSVDYEPYYILSIFPTEVLPAGDTAILPTDRDDLLFSRPRYIYTQSFSYEQQLSRRSYLTFYDDWRTTQAEAPVTGLDVNSLRAGVRYGYRTSQYSSLRFGYAYRLGNYGLDASQRFESHDLDFSIDYRKPLPHLRNTTFGFGVGSSRISREPEPAWTVVGNANLRHEMGAGWFIQADYARNAQLVEGFGDPFFVNTVTGSVGGFLGHRVEVLASTGYSVGEVGFGSDTYASRQGSARIRWALATYLALDAEGLLIDYGFDDVVPVPGAAPANLNRWAVRCNIALWLPLSR